MQRACLLAALVAVPALADVDLRIEAQPATRPMEVFVRVREDGQPVAGLARGDFSVRLDGQRLSGLGFRQPVEQDPARSLSIVFVMADGRAVESAIPAITKLPAGTHVAILRAKYMPGDPTPFLRIHPFTQVDGDSGTKRLAEFLRLSINDLAILRYGSLVSHLDWLKVGVDLVKQSSSFLPRGPKAIVLVGNGRYIGSGAGHTQSDVVARANAIGVSVFSIGTQDFRDRPGVAAFMSAVATDTGGRFLRGHATTSIGKAYASIQELLGNAYRLIIPVDRVTDCSPHMLEVRVLGESSSAGFARCDTTPDPLEFDTREGVAPGSVVVSNTATITGIDGPVEVRVHGGQFSLGCRASFTRAPGIAFPGDLVCVRHLATTEPAALTETTLVVGGVPASFYSTTLSAGQ
jgi:hypothetical protein